MSALGTRTNRVVPLVWLKRVGFRQASKEWRVTFFSRAPRILTHGFGATAGVAANDIHFLAQGCHRPARLAKIESKCDKSPSGGAAGCAVVLSCARSCIRTLRVQMLLIRSANRQPDMRISLVNESDSSTTD